MPHMHPLHLCMQVVQPAALPGRPANVSRAAPCLLRMLQVSQSVSQSFHWPAEGCMSCLRAVQEPCLPAQAGMHSDVRFSTIQT